MKVPRGLEWWAGVPGGPEWLASLPSIVESCADRWSLRVGAPFAGANVSHVLAVERVDGTRAVLKINFPDEESEQEPDALLHWRGQGAVHLLEYDESVRALLVERCEPGTQLWSVEDDERATAIAAGVLRRLWQPAPSDHRFRTLEHEAAR